MDEYLTISAAARHRDWEGCSRLMFRELYVLPWSVQRDITAHVLSMYLPIWTKKHPNDDWIKKYLAGEGNGRRSDKDGFSEPLNDEQFDAADVEFDNAMTELDNALPDQNPHSRTSHFATAIRSAVLAMQMDRWIHDFPEQYNHWSSGRPFIGPTFLEDEAASKAAESAWVRVDSLFKKEKVAGRSHRLASKNVFEIEQAYSEWEKSLL